MLIATKLNSYGEMANFIVANWVTKTEDIVRAISEQEQRGLLSNGWRFKII